MMRAAAVFLAAILLSACGFYLRGDIALPDAMRATYVDYRGSDGELLRTIGRALALSGAGIARSEAGASAILRLPTAAVRRRVLAKDTEGKAREYEVTVQLKYSLVAPDGFVLVPLQTVERRGNVALDPSEPLANAGEVARAVEGLREDAIWDMLHRIAATEIPPRPVDAAENREAVE